MQKLVLLYRNAVPGSDCSVCPSAFSAACCHVSTPCPKYRLRDTLKPDMCDRSWRTVMVAIRASANGPLRPSCSANGWSSWILPSSTSCMTATDVSIFETLPNRKRVVAVAVVPSSGFSMPNAAACSTSPSRMTAVPAETSPMSTVAAAMTASNAAALNGRASAMVVATSVVVGATVDEVVVGDIDVVVAGDVVVVDSTVLGRTVVTRVVVATLVSFVSSGVVTDFAEVSSVEPAAKANATAATPIRPPSTH